MSKWLATLVFSASILASCGVHKEQSEVRREGTGTFWVNIRSQESGLCLKALGNRIVQSMCMGLNEQMFAFMDTGRLRVKGTDRCVEAVQGPAGLGHHIFVLRNCGPIEEQQFKVRPNGTIKRGGGSAPDKCVTVMDHNSLEDGPIISSPCGSDMNQKFDIVYVIPM